MKTMIMAGLLTLALVTVSSAAPTATLVGTYNSASWGVWLLGISSGDNDGVASVVFKLNGIGANNNVSPKTDSYIGDGSGVVDGTFGFSGEHANDLMSANLYEFRSSIKAADITNNTAYLLRHMGQQVVPYTITNDDGSTTPKQIPTSPALTLTVPANNVGITPGNYPNSIKLAQGAVQAGHIPAFVAYPTGAIAGVNYIVTGQDATAAMAASDITAPAFIPEPATLALLAMGGLVTLIRRRRK